MPQQNGIFDILSEMRDRVSTKPLDKVAGLVYLLRTHFIPIYDAGQLEEDAWEVLINVMSSGLRAELLFYYPQRGEQKQILVPVMAASNDTQNHWA